MTICGLLNKFLKRIHCYERYFKMDELTRYIKKLFMRILLSPMKFLPLKKNRVLLVNNLSLNYSDNLKYIAAYLMENYTGKFEIFFAVKDPSHFTGPVALGMRPIKFNSLQYFSQTAVDFLISRSGKHNISLIRAMAVDLIKRPAFICSRIPGCFEKIFSSPQNIQMHLCQLAPDAQRHYLNPF